MLFVLIPLIAFIGCLIYGIKEREGWFGFFAGLMIAILLALLLFLTATLIGFSLPQEIVKTETIEICALADSSQLEGSMSGGVFLARGTIDEELKYQYLYKSEKGLAYDAVPANESYLNYTDETPYLVINTYGVTNKFYRWAFGNFTRDTEYIFYLPEDAQIIDNYIIDFD